MAPRRPCPRNPNGHQGQQARIQRNRVMDKAPTFVGIDVSKRRLDIHLRPSGEGFAIDYDDESVAALVARLVALAPALIVLEATGAAPAGRGHPSAGRPGGAPAAAARDARGGAEPARSRRSHPA